MYGTPGGTPQSRRRSDASSWTSWTLTESGRKQTKVGQSEKEKKGKKEKNHYRPYLQNIVISHNTGINLLRTNKQTEKQ